MGLTARRRQLRRRLGPLELRRLRGPDADRGRRRVPRVPRPHRDDEGRRGRARLRPGHVGVRARAGPLRHADGPDAAAPLDQRLHRLDGGPLLRVLGHHAVPLPQPVRALRRAVAGPAGPALRAPRRAPRGRAPPAPGRDVLPDDLADGSGPGRGRRGPHRGGVVRAVDGLRGGGRRAGRAAGQPARRADRRRRRARTSGWRRPSTGTWTPTPTTCSWPPTARRSGPGSTAGEDPPAVPVEPVEVTNIEAGDDRISFDVDQIGQPVLVRASYFPNWDASGAQGPYRVAPEPHGRGPHRQPRRAALRLDAGRPPGLAAHLPGHRRRRPPRPPSRLVVPVPPEPVATSVYGPDPPDCRRADPDAGLGGDRPTTRTIRTSSSSRTTPDEVPVGAAD